MAKSLHDLALEQLRAARQEMPVLDDAKMEVLYQLALCLEKLGRQEEALVEFKAIYAADIGYRDVAERVLRSRTLS